MTGLYVYGIVDRPLRPRTRGIYGRPVRSVSVGRLYAIVESAGRPPKASLAKLNAQSRVLAALVDEGFDVLPARFGTFVPGIRQLEHALAGRSAELRRALRHVRGCVQMTLRLEGAPRGPDRGPGPSSREETGAEYLRARVAADRARDSDPVVLAFNQAVAPFVRGTRLDWHGPSPILFHLVPRTKMNRYLAALTDEARRQPRPATLSGPFAPFAFVETSPLT